MHRDIVPVVTIFPAQIRDNPKWPQLMSTHIYHRITQLLMLSQAIHSPRMSRRTHGFPFVDDSHLCRTDRVSTCGSFHVVRVVVVWVFDSVKSSCVHSSSSTDASFSACLQLSSASTAQISKTCCLLLPVASDVNLAATSKVLLPGCSSDLALFAVLHTLCALRNTRSSCSHLLQLSSTLTAQWIQLKECW